MQIVRHGPRLHAEQLLQVGQRLLEKDQRLVILQVADVLAEDGVAPLGQAEGVLQLAAARQQSRPRRVPRSMVCGAKPRDRRSTRSAPSKVRTTESSARM